MSYTPQATAEGVNGRYDSLVAKLQREVFVLESALDEAVKHIELLEGAKETAVIEAIEDEPAPSTQRTFPRR